MEHKLPNKSACDLAAMMSPWIDRDENDDPIKRAEENVVVEAGAGVACRVCRDEKVQYFSYLVAD